MNNAPEDYILIHRNENSDLINLRDDPIKVTYFSGDEDAGDFLRELKTGFSGPLSSVLFFTDIPPALATGAFDAAFIPKDAAILIDLIEDSLPLASVFQVESDGSLERIPEGLGTTILVGTEGRDLLEGGSGADLIEGRLGGDQLVGSDGNDTLRGEEGLDSLFGGPGDDLLDGGFSADLLFGESGNDTLIGGPGDDDIDGGSGTDTGDYSGFGGSAVVSLASALRQNTNAGGMDSIVNVENLTGGIGNDRFIGSTLTNVLDGGAGSDQLFGLGGNDVLLGGDGNDNIQGGTLHDTLVGGLGRDIMVGGPGFDTFVFDDIAESVVGGQRDRINDFSQGVDTIDISGIDAIDGGGDDAFTFIGLSDFSGAAGEVNYRFAPSRTIVEGDVDGDGVADFNIELFVTIDLLTSDFEL